MFDVGVVIYGHAFNSDVNERINVLKNAPSYKNVIKRLEI